MTSSSKSIPEASRLRQLSDLLLQSFWMQWPLFVLPLLYLTSNALLLWHVKRPVTATAMALLQELLTFGIPSGIFFIFIVRLCQMIFIIKPESPFRAVLDDVRYLIYHPARLIVGIPVFVAVTLFNKAMVEFKPAIPSIAPFHWDEALSRLDRSLHFGFDPWVLLQTITGYDWAIFIINIAYNFWFVALTLALFWFGFEKQLTELRTRFFLSYMLAWWVGGSLLAVAFSSAGPVYYGHVVSGPDPYAPLLAHLQDVNTRVPLWFLDVQKMLWDGYIGQGDPIGISAFPSMHNASAVLFALTFFNYSKKMGYFFIAYAVVILVGSVQTGWHYAVDGYAGVLIAFASWLAAGVLARLYHARRDVLQFNESLASL